MIQNNFNLKPKTIMYGVLGLISSILLYSFIQVSFFYAEPGYVYHVRTVLGSEEVISDTGYKFYPFYRNEPWKRAMTVQASRATGKNQESSANLRPLGIIFLDQVDAKAQATVRFSIPTDKVSFLEMAHEYRTPDNLLRTALIPAFKETLQANASLMAAEEYYGGGRTQFNSEFGKQMEGGIYLVKREEITVTTRRAKSSANASKKDQDSYGDNVKTIFVVNKVLDDQGNPKRKLQNFSKFGITVVDAIITDMHPNPEFVERMGLKQKASADRAIAREQRVQEQEQRLLAIARGEREVAERQASAKVDQIQKTTEAETEKQLAITNSEKIKAQALIAKDTAEIDYEKAKIEAETIRTLADAEAYQKKVVLAADNALAQKLDAEIKIQEVWARAFAKRQVPTTVIGSNGSTNGDSDTKAFMQLLTIDAAKRLNYDRKISQ